MSVNTCEKTRILLVEDDPAHQLLAREALESNDSWIVDVADSAESALEKIAKSDDYQIIVTDYMLPDGDGIGLIDWVKKNSHVIVMSGHGHENVAKEAIRKGAFDYIVKDSLAYHLLPSVIEKAVTDLEKRKAELRRSCGGDEHGGNGGDGGSKSRESDYRAPRLMESFVERLSRPVDDVETCVSRVIESCEDRLSDGERKCLRTALESCGSLRATLREYFDIRRT